MKFNELQKIMYEAMKEKNKIRKDTVSSIINSAKNAAIANKDKDNITEELVDNAIRKELKVIKEQIETCPVDRTEKLEEFKAKLEVVESLMPKQLTADEIKAELEANFKEVLDTKNKGMIMKSVMPYFKGKADGKLVNEVIGTYL